MPVFKMLCKTARKKILQRQMGEYLSCGLELGLQAASVLPFRGAEKPQA